MTIESGTTDALTLLEGMHRSIDGLIARAASDPTAFEELRDDLTLLLHLEEEVLYPVLQEALFASESDLVGGCLAEHAELKQSLSEMAAMAAGIEEFDAGLQDLRDRFSRHVQGEECELFERARRLLDAEALTDLGKRMEARRAELASPALAASLS
jgi:hypothetical protein